MTSASGLACIVGATMLKNALHLRRFRAIAVAMLAPALPAVCCRAALRRRRSRRSRRQRTRAAFRTAGRRRARRDGYREKSIPADSARPIFGSTALIEGQSVTDARRHRRDHGLAVGRHRRAARRPRRLRRAAAANAHRQRRCATPSQVTLTNISLGSIYMNDVQAWCSAGAQATSICSARASSSGSPASSSATAC